MKKGSKHSEEAKRRISESKEGCLAWNRGIPMSDEAKEKLSKAHIGQDTWNKGLSGIYSEETRRKMSDSHKKLWDDPDYVFKMMKIWRITPNKSELKLLESLGSFGFSFTGDGKHIVGGKLPDFWNGENKLIELFGDYWHKNDDPEERINFFKSHGYDCLIIWESEMQNFELIKEKIYSFLEN